MIEECLQIQKKMLQLHAIVLYRKWGAAVGVSKRHSEGESNIGTVSGGLEFRHPETWEVAFIGETLRRKNECSSLEATFL